MAITPSITAKPGFQFLFQAADPAVSPSNFLTVGGLRNTSMTVNNNPADITNAASQGYREFLPNGGIQDFQVSADGVYDSQTPGARLVANAGINRRLIEGRLISGHGEQFIGNFVVSSFTRTGSFQDAETFSIQLQGSGLIVFTDTVTG